MRRAIVTSFLFGVACAAGAAWPTGVAFASPETSAPRAERFALEATALDDSLLGAVLEEPVASARARLWSRPEAEALAARVRDALAVRGALDATVRLVIVPGPGTAPGVARLRVEGAGGTSADPSSRPHASVPARPIVAVVRVDGDSAASASYRRAFDRAAAEPRRVAGGTSAAGGAGGVGASGGAGAAGRAAPIAAVAGGVAAVRDRLLEDGRYAGDVAVDSMSVGEGATRVYLAVRPGARVTVEALELSGSRVTRPNAAAAIAGLRPGDTLRPDRIDAARDRLLSSELFASVGDPRVVLGATPDKARVVIPVEEARSSRFEGVLGAAQGGSVTGALDLALENIAGTGRAAGFRWTGLGRTGTEYAARYREPALFGRPLDASASLEAHLIDSLFTQTRWSLGVGARAGTRGRVTLAFARTSTTYGGAARGTNGAWTGSAGVSWRALSPALNPRRGFAASLEGEGGRRRESIPGFPEDSRSLGRGALRLEGALPRGATGALYASARAEGTSLPGATFPAEELRYVGGNEGLRGHRERAFGGNRIAAFSLESRWITDPTGGRVFLFADAAWHDLDRPLAAGSSTPGSAAAALARTELSGGWDFGYGAGLRARVAAGIVGVELGLRPGASLGAATLHLRYGSRW